MKEAIRNVIKAFITIIIIIGTLYFIDNYQEIKSLIVVKNENVQEKILETNKKNLEIYYLDVGQADSTLIKYGNHNILIDAGNNKDGKKLVKYFQTLEIQNFDYVITTHAHEDHIGGMDNIIKNFHIEHFLIPSTEIDLITYTEVIKCLEDYHIKKETPKMKDKFQIEDLIFEILWIGEDKEDLNQNSIIIKLTYQNTSFLFTADASSEVEKEIIDQNIESDVLKVGHHGSRYSSSAQFINKVSPKYAIISVEKDNDYGFPHKVTLDKLKRIGAKIYRTDESGTIYLTSDGENITIETIKTDTNQK